MPVSIFDKYWDVVHSLLGGKPSKSLAITLSETPLASFDGVAGIEKLYQALACDGWVNSSTKNWKWRTEAPEHVTLSPEVSIEREIVAVDNLEQWTCQMSTSSGIQGPNLNKRRAIDLVKQTSPNHYAFVELKVESDNPLYAAFEMLSYALAYLHARRNMISGSGKYDVMHAEAVYLIVLGPVEWYEYKKRGSSTKRQNYNLDWLVNLLNDGLASITDSKPLIRMSFHKYYNLGNSKLTAEDIVRISHDWNYTLVKSS